MEERKETSHESVFISNCSFIALHETDFIKSVFKGQVGCVFSELPSYFVVRTEKPDNTVFPKTGTH